MQQLHHRNPSTYICTIVHAWTMYTALQHTRKIIIQMSSSLLVISLKNYDFIIFIVEIICLHNCLPGARHKYLCILFYAISMAIDDSSLNSKYYCRRSKNYYGKLKLICDGVELMFFYDNNTVIIAINCVFFDFLFEWGTNCDRFKSL